MLIVINRCYGGFSLSDAAVEMLYDVYRVNGEEFRYAEHELRSSMALVNVVRNLGPKANGSSADLKVVEIPDGVTWVICNYDGIEHIAEQHRVWS